ncbi:MAG: ribosome small subunit-dependent GTPase A [Gammaproteobacteria bacterium]|jgi:ribosome biogenesis GTPase|nr:ribosome small subunit-dependent GTPase A [Gammaproteobacteria bacterium]MDB4029488.1 ribosome small subunit-dependent GTPase A [Gammaproteobacteria bacterium]MDB4072465.1 ribosome small subunit-dependent GTPase A [Gammaproteobacteria bacterium]MDB9946698.1 ribosome small subunit-dependent GTPase A [Gammaproteobacteria bacterium]MDC6461319.1 ribosome small subunit-dependent GTPase A [Gammaproteobacteria bacterium]|tara:strand:- start:132 stop:1004 length:873 start_codon:yes stop_codon:yes gene_type:complete
MIKVQTGQIIEFYSNTCRVAGTTDTFKCRIQGRIDLVVGDFVKIAPAEGLTNCDAIVTERLDRATALFKSKDRVTKAVAANITHLGILVTFHPKTSLEFIDKWIVIALHSEIQPFIVFNKIDSLEKNAFSSLKNIYQNLEIPMFEISAKFNTNLENLISFLENETSIFVGNSGSGKSTLTSALTGTHILSKELSNNQGVHTTSVSTLYEVENQMKVIDSPGVRDIGIEQLSHAEILAGFKEIDELAAKCEFPKCGHEDDEGCAVMQALNNGDIEQSRYNNFMILNDAANL